MATGWEALQEMDAHVAAGGKLSPAGQKAFDDMRQAALTGKLTGTPPPEFVKESLPGGAGPLGTVRDLTIGTPERGETTGAIVGGLGGAALGALAPPIAPTLSVAGAGIGAPIGRALGGGRGFSELRGASDRAITAQSAGELLPVFAGEGARRLATTFPRFARFMERMSPGIMRVPERVEEATDVGGTGTTPYEAGKAVIGAKRAGEETFTPGSVQGVIARGRQWRDALFDDLSSIPEVQSTPVAAREFQTAVSQVPADLTASVSSLPLSKNAKEALEVATKGGDLSFAQARILDKELGGLAFRGGNRPQQYLAGQLQAGIRNDIEDFLQGVSPEASQTFQDALSAHKMVRSVEESSIRSLVRKNPEDVTKILFTPGNVSEAMDLKKVLPTEDWQNLVQSGFDRIVGKMVDPSGRMGPKEALKFARTIHTLAEEGQLAVLAGDEGAASLTALAKQLNEQFGMSRTLPGRIVSYALPLGAIVGGEEAIRHGQGMPAAKTLGAVLALGTPGGRRLASTVGSQLVGAGLRGDRPLSQAFTP